MSYTIIRRDSVPDESRGKGEYSIKRLFTLPFAEPVENIGLYETTIPSQSKVGLHAHERLEEVLYFLTDGRVEIEGTMEHFRPGDMVILPRGVRHEIYADEREVRLIAMKLPNLVDDKKTFK